MNRNDRKLPARHPANRRELHAYATQRANARRGSGMASVDIHAWLLAFAMAFLLRDDPYGSLPLQRAERPGPIVHASTERDDAQPSSTSFRRMPESIVRWIPGHCFTLPGMMCPLGLRQLADALFQALDREWEHALLHDLVDHFDGWRMPPEPPNGQIN